MAAGRRPVRRARWTCSPPRGLVLCGKALPGHARTTLSYTPTDRHRVSRPGGTVPAVVIDDGSQPSWSPTRVHGPETRCSLAQRYAAETAAIARRGGASARTLVIAPNRRWSSKDTRRSGRCSPRPAACPGCAADGDPQTARAGPDRPATIAARPAARAGRTATLPDGPGRPDRLDQRRAGRLPVDPVPGDRVKRAPPPHRRAARAGRGSTGSAAPAASAACSLRPGGRGADLQRSIYRAGSTAFRAPTAAARPCSLPPRAELWPSRRTKVRITHQGRRGPRRQPGHGCRSGSSTTSPSRCRSRWSSPRPAWRWHSEGGVRDHPAGAAGHRSTITVTAGAGRASNLPWTPSCSPRTVARTVRRSPCHVKVSVYGAIVVWISDRGRRTAGARRGRAHLPADPQRPPAGDRPGGTGPTTRRSPQPRSEPDA